MQLFPSPKNQIIEDKDPVYLLDLNFKFYKAYNQNTGAYISYKSFNAVMLLKW